MSIFPPVSNPRAAFRDLVAVMRGRSRENIIAMTLSVLITLIIVIVFLVDSTINTAPPPSIVYVEHYKPGRTDAEIIASQKRDQEVRRELARQKQEQFKRLEKRFNIE